MDKETIKLMELLLARLERISADSAWAHKASGIRGAILRTLENAENDIPTATSNLQMLIDMGFSILAGASIR